MASALSWLNLTLIYLSLAYILAVIHYRVNVGLIERITDDQWARLPRHARRLIAGTPLGVLIFLGSVLTLVF